MSRTDSLSFTQMTRKKVSERLGGKLLEKETALGTVPVIGFPRDQWAYRAKQLW